jgi:parallel beta-helix repeat protein
MRLTVLIATLASIAGPLGAQSTVRFRPGMIITESVRIEPGTFRAPAPASLDSALIVVQGDGVHVDLTGVTLEGTSSWADPDAAVGVAIRIDGGRDVTVRGGAIRGYRFAVLARGTRNLSILDSDLSYSWNPRLFSRVSHESIVDWLSYHHNDDGEWMRYGAAIYLEDVRGGEIRGNRAVQGGNGLLMTGTDSVTVRDNEFTYNSGLGIGLYRSSHNVIVGNRLDYNVRGYSHGAYQRGQDSAGLLLYAQSSHNVVAYNSATHSGDGLFLWAGQRTMDTGEGGANDNLIFYNDFSFAPTNGIEVTFSRNRLIGNVVEGSRYGVWGGYSWETEIRGNCFADNEFGVAIEHGQDNEIVGNRFDGDSLVISLWSRESEPADWGYPQHRDTRSRDHRVSDNVMAGNAALWRLDRTMRYDTVGNTVLSAVPDRPCRPHELLGAAFDSIATMLRGSAFDSVAATPPGIQADIPTSPEARSPRSAIVVDEWGPYDGSSPKLWPVDTAQAPARLMVLGPPGRWRVTSQFGVDALSNREGEVGDTLVVTPTASMAHDWRVELEYVGARTVSPRGQRLEAGVPVPFSFTRFDPPMDWTVRFFTWADSAGDPAEHPGGFAAMMEGPASFTRQEARLAYVWYRPVITELPEGRWALEATTSVTLPPGEYSLRAISDDGVRVWVDGELAVDHWEAHGSAVDYAPLTGGRHDLKVRYYQIDGWAEIQVDVVRGSGRSPGSPGPH